jgi:hypothetical protein
MTKTQKAHLPTLNIDRAKMWALVGTTLLFTTGCGGGYAGRQAPPANPILDAHLQRTVLEAYTPTAVPVEARLVLAAADGA